MCAPTPGRPKTRRIQMLGHAFRSLPASTGFLRLSRAVWCIACVCLLLMQTNFFDDYILMSEESLKKSTSQAFENLLDLLGWAFDRDGPKATNFARSANALGITFDLSCSESYILRIRNTESRKKEIVEEIGVILREESVKAGHARSKGLAHILEGRWLRVELIGRFRESVA